MSAKTRFHTIAEKSDTPGMIFLWRALMLIGMAVLTGGGALLVIGAKTKGETFIASSAAVVELNKKSDETAKRSVATAADLAVEVNNSKQKDSDLAVNLSRIADALDRVTVQQTQISTQQQINTTHIAVLVDHAKTVDDEIARHERALEAKRP